MKVTLIFPARDNEPIEAVVRTPPAGITLLAALAPSDIEVKVVDMLAGDRPSYEESTNLVGITVRTPIAGIAYNIADQFRARNVAVVLGGPHVSAVPLAAADHADAVVVGEAESTWPRLLADFQKGSLKKFYVCGPTRFNPGDNPIHHEPEFPSLNGLPVARRDLLPRRRYRMDTIFSTRGCPYDCNFCCVPDLFGKMPRHRPVEEVVAEVDTLGSSYFNLDDNIFGVRGDEEYYLELYGELARLGGSRHWTGQAGLGVVESPKGREILKRAVESGLLSVSVGIESVSQQGLAESRAWKKHSSGRGELKLEKLHEQIRIMKDHGLFVVGWFVIGWGSDDRATYEESLAFSDRSGIAPVIVNLVPFPGTRYHDELVQSGRMKKDLTWDDFSFYTDSIVYSHPILSEQEMVECQKEAMRAGYSVRRILGRSMDFLRHRPGLHSLLMSILGQRGLKTAFGG